MKFGEDKGSYSKLNHCIIVANRWKGLSFLGKTESVFQWNGNYRCKRFPSKLSWNEYVSNWRYHYNIVPIPLQNSFQSISPEMFRNPFLSVANYRFVASGPLLYRFKSVSWQVDCFCTISKPFLPDIRCPGLLVAWLTILKGSVSGFDPGQGTYKNLNKLLIQRGSVRWD
jgi:hypothetical protein